MAKILVTGSAGFIGFHTAQALLDQGEQVLGLDNLNNYYDPALKNARNKILQKHSAYIFHKCDLADQKKLWRYLNKYQIKAICHLGAQAGVRYSLQAPHLYESSNSLGTLNILEAARRLNVTQVVLASSSSVYGGNTKVPFAECDSVDNPVSLYAATKRHNELQAHAYHHLYGLNVICLRLFTVYGPWGRPDMALFKFVKKIMAATPIDVYNQGNMARDFTFISDIVAGIVAALRANHLQYEIINLGNSRPVKLLDFVTTIESVLGVTARKNYLPLQPGDVPQTYADISKARQLLNYEPQVDIETGVKKFIDWYRGCEVKLCQ